MGIDNEKNVIRVICQIAQHYSFNNPQNVGRIISKVKNNTILCQTKVGVAFINRLVDISKGASATDCIYCGRFASNRVICPECEANDGAAVINRLIQNIPFGNQYQRPQHVNSQPKAPQPSIDIDDFRELEDSIGRVASKSSIKEIKRLTFISITLGIVNLICMFFLALFLWKFIMSQS